MENLWSTVALGSGEVFSSLYCSHMGSATDVIYTSETDVKPQEAFHPNDCRFSSLIRELQCQMMLSDSPFC